ncbi:MAG: hypothetical protein Q9187_003146 [Circinaria calcarea]
MTTVDPSTGAPLPADAIQRVLFIASSVHVYSIPPATSTKGYLAASWTGSGSAARQIFTARLRVIETAIPNETVQTDVVLEDPSNGQLFAAAPYTDAGAVEQVLDSSRFFAVRVVGEGGRKAVLGIGFEERSEAIDLGIALQEVRKFQGAGKENTAPGRKKATGKSAVAEKVPEKIDFSLKEGQTIHIDIGNRPGKRREGRGETVDRYIAPPSGGFLDNGAMSFLPPPPSAQDIRAEKSKNRHDAVPEPRSIAALGFDDGEFGEFQ